MWNTKVQQNSLIPLTKRICGFLDCGKPSASLSSDHRPCWWVAPQCRGSCFTHPYGETVLLPAYWHYSLCSHFAIIPIVSLLNFLKLYSQVTLYTRGDHSVTLYWSHKRKEFIASCLWRCFPSKILFWSDFASREDLGKEFWVLNWPSYCWGLSLSVGSFQLTVLLLFCTFYVHRKTGYLTMPHQLPFCSGPVYGTFFFG